MRNIEILALLGKSALIADVAFSGDEAVPGSRDFQIDLSPHGHQIIRDTGVQEYFRILCSELPATLDIQERLEIRAVQDRPGIEGIGELDAEFPKILSSLEEPPNHRLLLDISSDLPWFTGHFPGNPVLAGVVQLHWAIQAAHSLLKTDLVLNDIDRLKFRAVVIPPTMIELTLNRTGPDQVQFAYSSFGREHSQGRLRFSEKPPC